MSIITQMIRKLDLPDEICNIIDSYNEFIHKDGIKNRRRGIYYRGYQPRNKNEQMNSGYDNDLELLSMFRFAHLCDKHNYIQIAKSLMSRHQTEQNGEIRNELQKLVQAKEYWRTDIIRCGTYEETILDYFQEGYIKYWARNLIIN